MDDQKALLNTILANPADDTARLVYADYLEENGDPDRAEFIRVQVEMARFASLWDGDLFESKVYARYRDRASELYRRDGNFTRWFGCGVGGDNVGACLTPNWVDDRVTRGFVSEMRMGLEGFLSLAPQVFAKHPIERVVLVDMEPTHRVYRGRLEGTLFWVRNDDDDRNPGDLRDELPSELFDGLRVVSFRDCHITNRNGDWCQYPTRGLADAALSRACVALGRSAVGLSRLTPPGPTPPA